VKVGDSPECWRGVTEGPALMLTGLPAWIKQLKTMYAVCEEKGHQHWRTEIAESKGNTKNNAWNPRGKAKRSTG